MSLDDFWEDFLHKLRFSLVVYKKEPAVERTIDFVSKFATAVPPTEEEKVGCLC